MKNVIFFIMALLLLKIALAQSPETDSLKRIVAAGKEDHEQVMSLESLSYSYLSSYPDSALQYAMKGIELAQKINDRPGEASCVIALGNVYFHTGDYVKALELYLQATKMKELLKNQNFAVLFFNIANVYTVQEDFRHALTYLQKAMEDDLKRKDSSGVLFDLYSLGALYHRMKKTDSALHYIRKAHAQSRELGDQSLTGAILNIFAGVYADLREFALASLYYHESIQASLNVNDREVEAEDYFGLAKLHNEMHNPDSTFTYAYKALAIAQEAPFLKQVADISLFLAQTFEREKKFDSAYKFFKLSTTTKDSLYSVDEVKKIQNLKFMELERQQAIKNAVRESRQRTKLYIVIGASFLFLVIALILWRNNNQKQKAYVMLQQQTQKTAAALTELKTTQTQLIQREKMASLGELTAGIAHEIQNPLNFVNNFSEVNTELLEELQAGIDKNDWKIIRNITLDLQVNEEKILEHGKRADSIVKNMLEHSRISKGRKQETDINLLTEEYLRLSYYGLRAKYADFTATLQTDFDETIGKIAIIPGEIGRVLLNLFNNAFYAVCEKKNNLNGGFEPTVSVRTIKKENTMEIIVKDNGDGISESLRHKVFQPFFTTKPAGEGTGLGLSLSYDIITKGHGGEIKVESKEKEGASFIISLPIQNMVNSTKQ